MKYEVNSITDKCKFYKLKNSNGEILATIVYEAWRFNFKYQVSFSYNFVKDNLSKGKDFHTLKEAKEYVKNIIEENKI